MWLGKKVVFMWVDLWLLMQMSVFSGKSDSADSQRRAEKVAWEAQQEEDMKEELQRRNRGEEMKRKRSEEARQLIQHKTSQDARAVFEQHTAYGQMNRQSSTSKSEGQSMQ